MPYQYLDDIAPADAAFRAWGPSREETFKAAAEAVLNVMVNNPASIRPLERKAIDFASDSLDLLLFQFLQELVYFKDAERLLLRPGDITISRKAGRHLLAGTLKGERIDPQRHELLTDIKAVTFHRLSVQPVADGWEATVVVDL